MPTQINFIIPCKAGVFRLLIIRDWNGKFRSGFLKQFVLYIADYSVCSLDFAPGFHLYKEDYLVSGMDVFENFTLDAA